MPRMFAAKMNSMDLIFGFNSSVIKSKAIDTINSILLCMEPSESDAAREKKVDENIIEARLRKPFTISLSALPTAGYTWTANYDSHILKLENERFQSSQTEAIGSGGMQIFTFMPILVGKVNVTALYKRSWENVVQDERTFIIIIRE